MDISKKLSFKNKETVCIDSKLIVPIPDGFHYSVDPDVIEAHRKIVIVPSDYLLSDDAMYAPLGFTIQTQNVSQKFSMSYPIEVYKELLYRSGEMFSRDANIGVVNPREGMATFYQFIYDFEDSTYVKLRGLIWLDETAYCFHMIYNHYEDIDVHGIIADNFEQLGEDWLEKFRMKGEKTGAYTVVAPPENLYRHYKSKLNLPGISLPGITVVTNTSGTEYQFFSFREAVENQENSESQRNMFKRIIDKDTGKYSLPEAVKTMQPIFHVNKSVFDCKHDRECEIEQGLLQSAYMMSALRSFAWTLAAYCEENATTPEKIKIDALEDLVKFIADRQWLNYDGDSHCKGLCSGNDLHVYFIPDKVSKADKKELLPSKESLENERKVKELFPTYNPIHSEVHSLDELRKDLEYIYPAVYTLWKKLLKNRDYNKALTGNEADIVYAWCSLAYAAREPFFSEDGPMRCSFKQIDSTPPKKTGTAGKRLASKNDTSVSNATDKVAKYSEKQIMFPIYEVKDSRKKFLNKSPGLRMSLYADGCDVRLEKAYDRYLNDEEREFAETIENTYEDDEKRALKQKLINKAIEIAGLFFDQEKQFDAKNNKAAMIKNGYLKTIYQLHALRSFAWTLTKWAKEQKKNIEEVTTDELLALADFIEKSGGANYNASSASDSTYCSSLRPKFEYGKIYTGTSGWVVIPKISDDDECFIASVGVVPTSVYSLRNDLDILTPAIDVIYQYISAEKEANRYVDSTLSDILFAWAVFAYAAREPFAIVKGSKNVAFENTLDFPEEIVGNSIEPDADGLYVYNDILIGIRKSKCNFNNFVVPVGIKEILFDGRVRSCINYDEHPEFCFLQNVKKLVLPITMRSFGCLRGCTALKEITFGYSEGAKADNITMLRTEIGDNAFSFNQQIESVNFLSSAKIGNAAFRWCDNLKSVVFWKDVDELGESAFEGCKNLEEIVFKSTLKKIGKKAFSTCYNIKRITIPVSVEEIGEGAFDSVYGLEGPDSWRYKSGETKFDFVFVVYKDSYAEKYAKSKGWYHTVILTEEQKSEKLRKEAEEKMRQEAARRAEQERIAEAKRREANEREKRVKRLNELLAEKEVLLKTIAENKGIFGEKARKRKETNKRLDEVMTELEEYKDLDV